MPKLINISDDNLIEILDEIRSRRGVSYSKAIEILSESSVDRMSILEMAGAILKKAGNDVPEKLAADFHLKIAFILQWKNRNEQDKFHGPRPTANEEFDFDDKFED